MKKAYKILLIGEDSLGLREFNITPKHIYLAISSFLAFIALLLFLFSGSYADWAFKNKLSNIKHENKELQDIIESQEDRIEKF